ncbi:nickel-binding protein [Geojedonia litorea]|uniref:Nickel-binding protein n=1 Tax=Geojedonia litorea TaxID=1268269 RepID=A0ABV9N4N8_9FLAO
MPIYMDRHIVPGIEAKDAAAAHRNDLKIQDQHGVRCMTYWVDEERGNAFCLIDAPNIEAVKKMHDQAHGLVPNEIIQVNSNVVEAFLGRIQDPDGCYYHTDDDDLKIFNDPAFRILLVTQIKNPILLKSTLGKDKTKQLLNLYNKIMHEQIQKHEGREVESEGGEFITSFISVNQAVDCAVSIMNSLHIATELLELKIGVNAGMPVTKSDILFGDTIKLAKYLCNIGSNQEIMMSSIINEIYKGTSSKNNFKCLNSKDEMFLVQLFDTLLVNYQNPLFDVTQFNDEMSMSKSKLFRKCTALMGMSPNALLREYRLLKSLELLKTGRNISQTMFDCGFNSPSYFAKCFQARFGMPPISYLREHS